MEAVGLVASVGTLIQGADFVRRTLGDYRKGGKDRERLLAEVVTLTSVLGQLKAGDDRATENREQEAWLDIVGPLASKGGVLEHIDDVISEIKLKVERKPGFRGSLVQWTWPFVKEDVDRNIKQMQRLSQSVSLVLQKASLEYTLNVHERVTRVDVAANKRELRAILDWLSSLSFLDQQRLEFAKAFPGTYEWFLSSVEYTAWKQKQKQVLYCSAIGGAGKTILASAAIDDLRMHTAGQDAGIFTIYCKHDRPDTHSVEKLAMAILRQLVQIKAGLIPPDLEELLKTHYYTNDTKPDLGEVLKIINGQLPTFSAIFIVVDGLDEILQEAAREEIVAFLMKLQGIPRIMFTSRPIDVIEKMFVRVDTDQDADELLSTEDEHESQDRSVEDEDANYAEYDSYGEVSGDDNDSETSSIEDTMVEPADEPMEPSSFVSKGETLTAPTDEHETQQPYEDITKCRKCDRDIVNFRYDCQICATGHSIYVGDAIIQALDAQKPGFAEEIAEEVTSAAKKMFLLAQLHMDALSNPDLLKFSEVLQALRTLPTKLYDSYDQALKRVQGHGRSLLRLVTFAQRPLGTKEVEHALSISPEADEVLDEETIPASALVSRCAGLVTLNENNDVVFSHYTIDNYFATRQDELYENGHKYMAKTCLSYLNLREFRNGAVQGEDQGAQFDARLKAYPFLEYASVFWGTHAHASRDDEILALAYEFIQDEGRRSTAVQALWFSSDEMTADWRSRNETSPLRLVMYFRYKKLANQLLQSGVDANIQDIFGLTPLMWAAQAGDAEMVSQLLDLEIPLNALNNDGETALHLAIAYRHEDVALILIEQNDIDVNTPISGERGTRPTTPLMHAIWKEQMRVVRMLLTRKDILINIQDAKGMTALHWAASAQNPEIVQALVAAPSIDLEPTSNTTSPPVILAAYKDNLHAIRALLDAGADINIRESELESRGTALMRAADNDGVAVVHELINRGTDWNAKDDYGRTAVHSAAINGSSDSLAALLNVAGQDINIQDIYGNTPLHDAAGLVYDCNCLELLLSRGADIEIRNKRGKTPLDVARAQGARKNAMILKKKYTDDLGMPKRTMTGMSMEEPTLIQAAEQGDEAAVDSILKAYMRDKSIDIEERDDWLGRTPLQHATYAGWLRVVQKLHHAGAKIDVQDKFGRTALHIAAMRRRLRIARYLLENGADSTLKDQWGVSAMDDASPSLEVLLIGYGIELTKAQGLERVLFYAAELGNMKAVQRLVEAGAEVQVKDSYGWSPYERAKQAGKTDVAKYLDRVGKSAAESRSGLHTPMTSSTSVVTLKTINLESATTSDQTGSPKMAGHIQNSEDWRLSGHGDGLQVEPPKSKPFEAKIHNQPSEALTQSQESLATALQQMAAGLPFNWRYIFIFLVAFMLGLFLR